MNHTAASRALSTFGALALSLAAFTGCATRQLVSNTAHPSMKRMPSAEAAVGPSKTFVFPRAWTVGHSTLARGAAITLTPEGKAVFTCSVSSDGSPLGEIALRISARRADGSVVFSYPAREHIYLRARRGGSDTPYDVTFGFDPRNYSAISRIEWEGYAEIEATPAGR